MNSSFFLIGSDFILTGTQVVNTEPASFEVKLNNDAGCTSVIAYQWFLNDMLIINENKPVLSRILGDGFYTVGVSILMQEGWSAVKELAFQVCAGSTPFSVHRPVVFGKEEVAKWPIT